jgi:hypothetical protein
MTRAGRCPLVYGNDLRAAELAVSLADGSGQSLRSQY